MVADPMERTRSERRAGARVTLDMETSLVLYQAELAQRTTIGNLSEGGCYLPVSRQFIVGERCRMELSVGEGLHEERVDLAGVVVRSDGEGLGIQFVDLTAEQQQCLTRILLQNGNATT